MKLPWSFHSKCSGVLCGLENSLKKSIIENINNVDWQIMQATCPQKIMYDAIDIFSVTTSMRYESKGS